MALLERRLFPLLLAGLASWACSTDEKPDWNDSDTGDTETETETETESASETDTGEDETPPDLPSACTTALIDAEASGEGDAADPAVASNGETLLAWAYDPQEDEAPEQWRIQAAPFDPATGIGALQQPMTASISATMPDLAASADTFAIAWLDTRWDLSCAAEDQESCSRDIAVNFLDVTGLPVNPTPHRITNVGGLTYRPAIGPVGSGWIVAWMEDGPGETTTVWAVSVDGGGTPGTPHRISEIGGVDDGSELGLATDAGGGVLVWIDAGQYDVIAARVAADAAPVGDPIPIDGGCNVAAPSVAAGAGEFLVSWSRRTFEDFEIYTAVVAPDLSSSTEPRRVTWTTSSAMDSAVAWNGASYGLLWQSNRNNGASQCLDPGCEVQILGTILDAEGAVASESVVLSDNPNPSLGPDLAWDGTGWTAVWCLRGDMRHQAMHGRMTCSD